MAVNQSWFDRFFFSAGGAKFTARAAQEPDALDLALADGKLLLAYAVEHGITVDADAAQRIIAASQNGAAPWKEADAGALLAAIGKISAAVAPVTADSLRACRKTAPSEIGRYRNFAGMLAVVMVLLSAVSFVTGGLSSSISADITAADQLAVALHTDLDAPVTSGKATVAPSSTLTDVQQFAALIRSVKRHADRLDAFMWRYGARVPDTLVKLHENDYELQSSLGTGVTDLASAVNVKTGLYQSVRAYAKDVQLNNALYYGAVASIFLPILYALLGACAYFLRLLPSEVSKGTFCLTAYGVSARFFVALIGGLIVGLFRDFTSDMSLSPLAVAFLVGYAADAFFSFLDSLTASFQSKGAAPKTAGM